MDVEANNRALRRIYHLAYQVGPSPRCLDDEPWPHSTRSLSAMACRAEVSGAILRRDHRVLFARQGSDSHGQFMRELQVNQVVHPEVEEDVPLSVVGPGKTGKGWSSSASRDPGEGSQDRPGPAFAAVAPLFGKPVFRTEPTGKEVADVQDQDQEPHPPATSQESRPSSQVSRNVEGTESGHSTAMDVESVKKMLPSADDRTKCFGFEWFPRMDVVESGTAYVITIELPGVSADGIHVEVVRGSLIVTGSRATDWWKSKNNGSNGGGTVYHRRELAQGPYRSVWRLPKNVDINGITAEFIDGFLRVLVPKIKIMTYL